MLDSYNDFFFDEFGTQKFLNILLSRVRTVVVFSYHDDSYSMLIFQFGYFFKGNLLIYILWQFIFNNLDNIMVIWLSEWVKKIHFASAYRLISREFFKL